MPIRDVLDVEEEDDATDRVYKSFLPVISAAVEVRVARAGTRGAKVKTLELSVGADEEPAEVARAVAERLVSAALDDATNHNTQQRYTFAALGKPLPDQVRPKLASITLTLGEGSGDVTMQKQTTAIIRDLGDRSLRALDSSLLALDKASSIIARGDAASVAEVNGQVELAKLGYEAKRDERGDQIVLSLITGVSGFAQRHGKLFDGIGDLMAAKARKMWRDMDREDEPPKAEPPKAEPETKRKKTTRKKTTRKATRAKR